MSQSRNGEQHTDEYGRNGLPRLLTHDKIDEDDYSEDSSPWDIDREVPVEEYDRTEEYKRFARMKQLCKERNRK